MKGQRRPEYTRHQRQLALKKSRQIALKVTSSTRFDTFAGVLHAYTVLLHSPDHSSVALTREISAVNCHDLRKMETSWSGCC